MFRSATTDQTLARDTGGIQSLAFGHNPTLPVASRPQHPPRIECGKSPPGRLRYRGLALLIAPFGACIFSGRSHVREGMGLAISRSAKILNNRHWGEWDRGVC